MKTSNFKMPSSDADEREFYPYYILFGHDQLPFKSAEEREIANQLIKDFVLIIEDSKNQSEDFARKIKDIDFEILLSRPPLGYFDKDFVLRPNFEEVEIPHNDHNIEQWKKWEDKYSFRDPQSDLIDDAIHSKSLKYNRGLNTMLTGYMFIHLATKMMFRQQPETRTPLRFNLIRFGKYAAVGSWLYGFWRGSNWYIEELKKTNIYDYKIKRARLFKDCHVARKIYKYGEERTKMELMTAKNQETDKQANALIAQAKS